MNFFGCHFCHEEAIAILAIFPFVGAGWAWVRRTWHKLLGKTPPCGIPEHTCHEHEEDEKPLDTDGGL